MNFQADAVRAIEAQQAKVKPRSSQWMVGEQLKEICRREPKSAELIAQDLQVEAMGITEAEKKIKAYADGHKTGSFACVTPIEADRILREFYGLPKPDTAAPPPASPAAIRTPPRAGPSGSSRKRSEGLTKPVEAAAKPTQGWFRTELTNKKARLTYE